MDNMGTNFFSVNFLDKVIKANLNYSFVKKLLCSYGDLEKKYITSNKLELYKDLQKQKKVILSKLNIKDNPKFGRIQASFKEIEANFDPKQIQDLSTPSYVSLTFKNSRWTVKASSSQEAPMSFKSPEDCIEYVSLLSNRDLKQAGYAMLHAKEYAPKEFILTAAEFDEEPAKDFNPEMVEETEEVELEPALEETAQTIDVNQVYEDEAGQPHTIMAVDSDKVVDSQNNIYPRTEVEKLVAEGKWKKLASLKKKAGKTLTELGLTDALQNAYVAYEGSPYNIGIELQDIPDVDLVSIGKVLTNIAIKLKKATKENLDSLELSEEQALTMKKKLEIFKELIEILAYSFENHDFESFSKLVKANTDFFKYLNTALDFLS